MARIEKRVLYRRRYVMKARVEDGRGMQRSEFALIQVADWLRSL